MISCQSKIVLWYNYIFVNVLQETTVVLHGSFHPLVDIFLLEILSGLGM